MSRHDQFIEPISWLLTMLGMTICIGQVVATEPDTRPDIVEFDSQPQQYLLVDEEIPKPSEHKENQHGVFSQQQQREQQLWRMLQRKQFDALRKAINDIRASFPLWQPPAHMLREIENASQREAITAAIQAGEHSTLLELAKRYPLRFRCVEVHHLWALAESYIAIEQHEQAFDTYHDIVSGCASAHKRLVTLYKAEQLLPLNRVVTLVEIEDHRPPRTQSLEKKYQDLRYRIYYAAANQPQLSPPQTLKFLTNIELQTVQRRDANTARLFARHYQMMEQIETALVWMQRAADWSGEPDDIMNLYRQYLTYGKTQQAQQLYARVKTNRLLSQRLQSELQLSQVRAAFQTKDYGSTLELLQTIEPNESNQQEVSLYAAWSHYHLGYYAQAAREFELIYRRQADLEVARGLSFSLFKADDLGHLVSLEQELAGPLSELLPEPVVIKKIRNGATIEQLHLTIDEAARIRVSSSRSTESQVTADLLWRNKSGDSGTSQLQLSKLPIVDIHFSTDVITEWGLQIDRVILDSGTPANGALIGSDAIGNIGQNFSPTTKLESGWEGMLRFRHYGQKTWFAGMGISATGGEVDGTLQGELGIQDYSAEHGWRLALTKLPVRESILSYTGLRDPFNGQQWGRVSRTTIEAAMYQSLSPEWQWSSSAALMQLTGEGVKQNQAISLYANASRQLNKFDAQEVSFGPYALYQSYQENLSKFTRGHGGYFSPQLLLQLGISAHYLSPERRDYLWQTDLAIGYQYHKEDATAYFPLAPNNQIYTSNSESGIAAVWDIAAVKQIQSSPWQYGGGLRVRVSPEHNDFTSLVFIRYLFSARTDTLRQDLPLY